MVLLPPFLWFILCDNLLTIQKEGYSFPVDPFMHPVHTDDVHAHRAILIAMAVASVSGHSSSSRSVVPSFLTGFFPVGWSPLQRRHADPVPQQGLAEREKAFGGAHPLFAKRQLHVPAAVLQPPPCLPGREEPGTSQVPVRYTSFSWDQCRIFQ